MTDPTYIKVILAFAFACAVVCCVVLIAMSIWVYWTETRLTRKTERLLRSRNLKRLTESAADYHTCALDDARAAFAEKYPDGNVPPSITWLCLCGELYSVMGTTCDPWGLPNITLFSLGNVADTWALAGMIDER